MNRKFDHYLLCSILDDLIDEGEWRFHDKVSVLLPVRSWGDRYKLKDNIIYHVSFEDVELASTNKQSVIEKFKRKMIIERLKQ